MISCHQHDSQVLRDNFSGDPHTRDVWVYLPPGYQAATNRYPVVYCLAAYGASGAQLIAGNAWSPSVPDRFASMIASGLNEAILVFPDCFTRWGGSQYVNSSALGPYENYVCDELVSWVDNTFRTIPRSEARGVIGRSSGGYGAFRLATQRPDVFTAFGCLSGDMGFHFCFLPGFATTAGALRTAGSIEGWVHRFENSQKRPGRHFTAVMTLAMAAAYSPNPDAPFGIDLPFSTEDGSLRSDTWGRWLEHDPLNMIDSAETQDALRSMRLAYFDCGRRDEHFLHLGLEQLVEKLKAQQIHVEQETYDDGHRGTAYRMDTALPRIVKALVAS